MAQPSRVLLPFAALVLLSLPAPGAAATLNVPADYATIQAAINAASNGDTILVSDGTYTENIDFKGKAITLKSINGPSTTIIDGGSIDTVVKFITNETSSSVIDGFTIRNGLATSNYTEGGGIFVASASPTISNNKIINNKACAGGGIGLYFSSPTIQKNIISNNAQGGCVGGTGGGGILIGGASHPQILNNTISNNSMGSDGGGISLFAGGTPTIQGNTITGNTASGQGGGIVMFNDSDPLIIDNVISGNSATQGGGIAGLVPSGSAGPTIVNNTIVSNSATSGGSEIYLNGFYSQTQFFNNLFVGTPAQIAFLCDTGYSSTPPIYQFNDLINPSGTPFGGACTFAAGTSGNISTDPLFVSSPTNFHLLSTSPAIDAGSNTAPSLPEQDIEGNDRVLDGKGACTATVDMGAYEFAHPSSLTLSPASIVFPDQLVGSTSGALTSTIANSSSSPITVCSMLISGTFAQTNTCGSVIASKGSCTVNLTFSPTAKGPNTGYLRIITGDAGSPQIISLSGKATAPWFSPDTVWLNFQQHPQLLGTTSSPMVMTLTNTGDGDLAISNVTVSGDFAQTNTCGSTLAPSASCTFSVTFTPTATGDRTGFLTINDNAGGPHQVNLIGTANDFTLVAAPGGSTSATVTAGAVATYNLLVSPVNGFNGAVTLACSGAPAQSTCNVSPASVTPNGTDVPILVSVLTTAAGASIHTVPPRLYPPMALYALALAALAILLLTFSSRQRPASRRFALISACAVLLLMCISVSGCGGGGSTPPPPQGTPKGTYSLTLTGTSNGASRQLTVKLTVN